MPCKNFPAATSRSEATIFPASSSSLGSGYSVFRASCPSRGMVRSVHLAALDVLVEETEHDLADIQEHDHADDELVRSIGDNLQSRVPDVNLLKALRPAGDEAICENC